MPEVIVLGSGTSNGVPMLCADYPPAFLANPKNHRTRSSIVIGGPTGNLLVDCSPELRLQMVRENIKRVEAVLITHTHADHVMGMDDLRSLCMLTGRAIPVYLLPEYFEDITRIYPYAFKEFPPGIYVPRFDLIAVPPVLEVGGLSVHTFPLIHGRWPVVGLRVNRFAYLTDVGEIPAASEAFLADLDVLILDAVRLKPHPNHFNFEQALEVAAKYRPRMTYFTHLSHDYDHDVTEKTMPRNVRLAYDGLRIPI